MVHKNTDQLRQELMDDNDLDRVLTDSDGSFFMQDLPSRLQALYQQQSLPKSTLAKRSDISEVYLHQVFSGCRTPSRNRLLCLCFGLGATVDEAQELLRHAGHALLYPRDRRDAIILFTLSHGMTLPQVNDKLFAEHAEPLC